MSVGNRKHFNVTIPCEKSEPAIIRILEQIRPEWSVDRLQFKFFSEGISNKLVGCMLKDGDEKDLIMFRMYGNQTELFIDRNKELANVELLNSRGFAPPLHCTFENGYCCGFIPGRTLETEEMSDAHFSELIARKLARVHAIKLPSDAKQPCAFNMIEKFLRVLPERFEDPVKQKRYEEEILSKINVVEELKAVKAVLGKVDLPLVYCHNDLLCKNIIYSKDEDDISFIDYEYGGCNYSLYDIANHFNEFAGIVETPDFKLFPTKEFQLRWLKIYLEEKAKAEVRDKAFVMIQPAAVAHLTVVGSQETISETYLEKLYIQVNQFCLASHLFWGVWSLLQANFSSIDFDYVEYSKQKLSEYLLRKNEFLGS